jgi:hypothetical protein
LRGFNRSEPIYLLTERTSFSNTLSTYWLSDIFMAADFITASLCTFGFERTLKLPLNSLSGSLPNSLHVSK